MTDSTFHTRSIVDDIESLFDVHCSRLFVVVFNRKAKCIEVYHRRSSVLCCRIPGLRMLMGGSRSSFLKKFNSLASCGSEVYWIDEESGVCKLDLRNMQVSRQGMDYDVHGIAVNEGKFRLFTQSNNSIIRSYD